MRLIEWNRQPPQESKGGISFDSGFVFFLILYIIKEHFDNP